MQLQARRELHGDGVIQEQNMCPVQDIGRKLVFDNIDYKQQVHYMTEEHQNIDAHYVTYMSVENRVAGNHLSAQSNGSVMHLENGKCLPSARDNVRQHANYVALIGRIITAKVKCLQFLQDVSVAHIPHLYSMEMRTNTDVVCLILLLSIIINKINYNY